MDRCNNIRGVVLSSHVAGLGVIRALGSMGVPITAVSYQTHDIGNTSKYVSESFHVTSPDLDEARFIEELILKVGRKERGPVYIIYIGEREEGRKGKGGEEGG